MATPQQVDALQAQLEAVPEVKALPHDDRRRREWERATVRLLRDTFGDDSHQLKQFLDCPIGNFAPNMSPAEVQDNYDYLLRNQALALERIIQRTLAADTASKASIRVMGRQAKPLPEHFILDEVLKSNDHVGDKVRQAILGLENLMRSHAPWSDVRQQLFVVLAAEESISVAVLRALPPGLPLLHRAADDEV